MENRCWIEFHCCDYKLIFVFIFPICEILNTKIRGQYISKDYRYFQIFTNNLSYLFSFIFVLIIYFKNKKEKTKININELNELKDNDMSINEAESKNSEGVVNFEIKKEDKKNLIQKMIVILIIIAISFVYNYFNYESYLESRTLGMAYKIIIFFLLSLLILKYKYEKHNYIFFIINTFTLIAKYIINIIYDEVGSSIVLKNIWFFLVIAISYCLIFILGKFYMNKYCQSPYIIMFSIGIIIDLILIIIGIIKKFFFDNEIDIFQGFQNNLNDLGNVFWFIGDILTQFGIYLGLWITVYYFTPTHTIISENIMEIGYYFVDFKNNQDNWKNKKINLNLLVFSFIHIINLICSLIFNEIIILNFCGLDYYTKIRIKEREIKDSNKIISNFEKNHRDNLNTSSNLIDSALSMSQNQSNRITLFEEN
jgi:hypothetical protein